MKKAELLKLPVLKATPRMLRAAGRDVLKSRNSGTWRGFGNGYENRVFIRCIVSRGILKVALFMTENLKSGGNLPSYELYISKQENRFITYDRMQNKWRNAKLDMINWPGYMTYSQWDYISEKDYMLIKRYLETKQGGYPGLLEYQLQVREDELKRKHRRQTDPWDLELAQTPPLPKDWEQWVYKDGLPERYIYYDYRKGGAKTGYCTYCEKDVPISDPRHNKEGRCPKCGKSIIFKATGRAGTVKTERHSIFLLQRCDFGFMIREFYGYKVFHKGEYMKPYCTSYEVRRSIYSDFARHISSYYWGDYKHAEMRWIKTCECSPSRSFWDQFGFVYPKTLPSLAKKELLKTGLPEFFSKDTVYDPEKYLAIWREVPQLEQFVKAGLHVLTKECLHNFYTYRELIQNHKATSLLKALGIDAQQLNRVRTNGWGCQHIQWLQNEKQTGKTLADSVISWFVNEKIDPEKIDFVADRMSGQQIYNYIRRQMDENGKRSSEVITTWADYLSMAKKLGMDTSDAIHYRVRKLFQRHQELVELSNQKALELQAKEIREKFKGIEDILKSLKKLYSYQDADYTVTVPTRVDDILLEGKRLHHCVGGSDRYWERIESRESYILFLRRTENPEKAYYTLEIEPDGTVRQKRTMYDRQEDDIVDATRFLKKWQGVISERLTEQEFALARKSRVLRAQEFKDLQENQIIINTGELRGSMLVDVLMADLLENQDVDAVEALPAAA